LGKKEDVFFSRCLGPGGSVNNAPGNTILAVLGHSQNQKGRKGDLTGKGFSQGRGR